MNLLLAEFIASLPQKLVLQVQTKNYLNYCCDSGEDFEEIDIRLFDNGVVEEINFLNRKSLHRPFAEGPAFQDWWVNGQPREMSYWENGNRHRPISEGPALQVWNRAGQLEVNAYYENGIEVKI